MTIFKRFARRFFIGLTGFLALTLLTLLVLHKDKTIKTDIWIDRPPYEVWHVLTATKDYPLWNPMISRLEGQLREGNVIEFTNGRGSDAMVFHPTILVVQANQELKWKGHVWMPGILDGTHRFYLEAQGGQTHFIQSEDFGGLFAGRLTDGILKDTVARMQKMNLALKKRTESTAKP